MSRLAREEAVCQRPRRRPPRESSRFRMSGPLLAWSTAAAALFLMEMFPFEHETSAKARQEKQKWHDGGADPRRRPWRRIHHLLMAERPPRNSGPDPARATGSS